MHTAHSSAGTMAESKGENEGVGQQTSLKRMFNCIVYRVGQREVLQRNLDLLHHRHAKLIQEMRSKQIRTHSEGALCLSPSAEKLKQQLQSCMPKFVSAVEAACELQSAQKLLYDVQVSVVDNIDASHTKGTKGAKMPSAFLERPEPHLCTSRHVQAGGLLMRVPLGTVLCARTAKATPGLGEQSAQQKCNAIMQCFCDSCSTFRPCSQPNAESR